MSDIAIVAIPAEDEPVWKVSSEKVPHMTLLFLEGPLDNEMNTIQYVQHAVEMSLSRFGMSVDRRGELGPDNADVLFFDKSYCGKELLAFRGFLLQNAAIKAAYSKAEQYPVWTPHLTLGYPATPAKPNPDDSWGLKWINFDRVAVWTEDYDGPEFVLKKNDDRVMDLAGAWSEGAPGDGLLHWGIGNPFKEDKVKRDGKGQFSNVKSVLGELVDKAFDSSSIELWTVGDSTFATLENGDGANKYSREFEVTQTFKTDPTDNQGALKVTDNHTDSKGRWVREVEDHDGHGQIKTTRVIMTKSKNLPKDRDTAVNFISEKEFEDLDKKLPKPIDPKTGKIRHSESLDEVLMHFGIKNPFKESDVKRDGKGQFASKSSVIDYDNLPDDYSSTTYTDGSGYTYTEESYTDELGQSVVITTKTGQNGQGTTSMKVNGKEAPAIVNFDKLAKGIEKAVQNNQPGAFNKKVKLDTSQVTDKGHERGAFDEYKFAGRFLQNKVKNKVDQLLGKETKLQKSRREYLERQKKLDHSNISSESVDDVLMHFGVRGMRWGVRRATGPSGLVEGTVAAAIKSGQHPSAHGSSAPVTKGKKAVAGSHSEDHKKMVDNLNKKVEDLSTAEIKQITQRLKAVNDFKTASEADKAAKASLGRKLSGWALNQVKEGAKQAGGQWIREQTGGALKGVLPDLVKAKKAGEKKANNDAKKKNKKVDAEFIQTKAKSSSEKPSPERQLAIETLATQIQRLPKDKGD